MISLLPPGPRGHPILGSIRDIQRENIGTFMTAFAEYGDIVSFRGPLKIDLVVHPDGVKHVMQDNHKNYPRPGKVQRCLATIVGSGLVAAEGPQWVRSRRLAQPAFHSDVLARCGETFTRSAALALDRWEAKQAAGIPIDVKSEMMHLALTNLSLALFESDLGSRLDRIEPAVADLLRFTNRRLTSPIDPYLVPSPQRRNFNKALSTLDSVLYPMVAQRRRTPGGTDLVSRLVDAIDTETGARFSDEQVRDQVSGFFVAGHETVSSALTWTNYLLSLHPDAWRRLKSEVDQVLGDRTPTVDDLPRLGYTTRVLKEAMRLYPPIFVYMRCATSNDTILGYRVPAGQWVVICPYVTHRHPDFWENPEAFDPDRFTAERGAGRPRMAYLPFGGGPRKCIGDSFAMLQMPLVLAMIVQRFRLELLGGTRVVPEPAISLRPRDPVLMRVSPAQSVRAVAV